MGTPASLSSPLPSASLEHIPQRAASSASLATWVLLWVSDTITPLPSSLEKPRNVYSDQPAPSPRAGEGATSLLFIEGQMLTNLSCPG